MKPTLSGYAAIRKYQDVFVLLAWTTIVTGILLNIFYRSPGARQLTINIHDVYSCRGVIPCQTFWDLGIVFIAAIGAGLLMRGERLLILGFVFVHLVSTTFFVLSLTAPVLLGFAQYPLSEPIVQLTLAMAFVLQFPIAVILSLIGSVLGGFFRAQLEPTSQEPFSSA